MGEQIGTRRKPDRPWPWGPAEDYVERYEQYLQGYREDEPTLPEGLSARDKELIRDEVDFLHFRADYGFSGSSDDALALYETLLEIRTQPETTAGND